MTGSHRRVLPPRPRKPHGQTFPTWFAWLGLAMVGGAIVAAVAAGSWAAMHRVDRPPATEPVPVVPSQMPVPAAGDGGYQVASRAIAPGRWLAPGGPRCAWSVRDRSGNVITRGSGPAAQSVTLTVWTAFQTSGCGGWRQQPDEG